MNKSLQRLITFAAIVLVVAVLRWAEDVIIPIALAALLAFLLTPLVVRLQRWKVPKVPAVVLAVTIAFTVLGIVAWIVTVQLIDLAQKLPDYERNIYSKIESLRQPQRPAAFARVIDMIENLRSDMRLGDEAARQAEAERAGESAEPPPVPVEVKPAPSTPLQMVHRFVGPLLGPLGTGGIAIVLVVAMLLQREDVRDRFIKVVSSGRINVATQAIHDAARRVSRYLLMQLIVNASYGFPIGIGLHFIGIPNALLWGLMATVLRFIPFLGPWIAALFPVALAVAVAPGWEPLLYTIILFVVMELISNNIVEVWLYGAGTGISNLALFIAAIFWTWVWGPIGLFLSTPLTVCILVIGKYVPGLRFLSMLLGSEPVLEPQAQFYQRMLAMDYEAMLERARTHIERNSLAEFYDGVFIPALTLAEADRHRGTLAEVRQRFILEAGRELIEELDRRQLEAEDESNHSPTPDRDRDDSGDDAKPRHADPVPSMGPQPARVLILAARDDADELVAYMLQHLLRERGLIADVAPVATGLREAVARVREHPYDLVVVSSLPPSAVIPARRMAAYLREHVRNQKVLLGIWSEDAQVSDLRHRLREARPDGVASRVGEATALIQRLLEEDTRRDQLAPAGDRKPDGTLNGTAVPPLALGDVEPEARFDMLARDLAKQFDVPVSLITIADIDRKFWESHRGLPSDVATQREQETARAPSLNGEDFKVVEDVTDAEASSNPFLVERGVRFYACAALRRKGGQPVGTLCLVDTKPRTLSAQERALLRQRAAEFMAAVEK
jgi:predicted PurR-regulated permease PerM/CheY-like chemotaxis protein